MSYHYHLTPMILTPMISEKGHFKGEEHHNGSYYMKNGTRVSADGRFIYLDASPYTVHQDSNLGTYVLVGAVMVSVLVLGGELVILAYYWVMANPLPTMAEIGVADNLFMGGTAPGNWQELGASILHNYNPWAAK